MIKVNQIQSLALGEGVQPTSRKESAAAAPAQGQSAFAETLQQAMVGEKQSVRFSAHAQRRMATRSIQFGRGQLRRLEDAVDKAASKGGQDSLILMDELALIVNIKNRTVLTAIDKSSRRENVFTNIDSVVMT